MSAPHLVIFDCDGVLVDSEPISIGVLRETIAADGVKISEADAYRHFLGRSMASIADTLHGDFGLAMTDSHLERIRSRLSEEFRAGLKPIAGIAEALDGLTMPFCVASSSKPERIRLSLEIVGILDRFEPHIYSSTMVKNGKPAPDLFLHAARGMGVAPADCLVVEDSAAGIEAAKRAGMRVFAFIGGSHGAQGDLRRMAASLVPEAIFDDMRALPHMLEPEARFGSDH